MKNIFKKVLKEIIPEKNELKEVKEVVEKINKLLKDNDINAECVAGGSYAKGTILKNDFDIDLFVRFDYEYKEKAISEMLGKILKPLKPEMVHGSRDYYQLEVENITFEIIPVLRIDDYKQAVNVTDMSPLHVDYVKKKLSKEQTDEIRLAKKFFKGINVYGAESYIRGFSGHVLDLLIIHYKNFVQLLEQAAVWGEKAVIDIEKHLKDPVKELNKAKTESPLIIVDPVQPDRNAAAAVSKEKFELFKKKARDFLENPSEEFFKKKKTDVKRLEKKYSGEWLTLLEAIPLKGKDDVVGTKVLKVFEKIESELMNNDFKVLEAGWEYDEKSVLYFAIKKEKLSDEIVLRGPPKKAIPNAERFKEKHANVFEEKGILYAKEKRKYKEPEGLIKELIRNNYVKERVEKIHFL